MAKARLSLGTTIEIRGRYYRIGAELEDEVRTSDITSPGEFKAVVKAKYDDLEDVLQEVLTEKMENLVRKLEKMKFAPRTSEERRRHA